MTKNSLSLKSTAGNHRRGLFLINVRLLTVFPCRTMEKIVRLCPRLTKIRVLMEDLNFRYFEMLPHLEEVKTEMLPHLPTPSLLT